MGTRTVPSVDGFDDGWDVRAVLVDGRWVDRTPRRPEVVAQLRREAALMPWLAPQVRMPVATPHIVSEEPLTLRHSLIVGEPCPGTAAAQGVAVGEFLRQLHRVDPQEAVRHGARDARSSFTAARAVRERMRQDVLPLISADLQRPAAELLDRLAQPVTEVRVIHGDLGPNHIRVDGEAVAGVIDWGDCCVGDPALDLSWTVFGAGPDFAGAVRTAYGVDEALARRALDWHLLGPWHEVLYGMDVDEPDHVGSGLRGVADRLRARRRLAEANP